LRQILSNLVSNALKFTEAGRIELKVRPSASRKTHDDTVRLLFSVADTGIGIQPEQADRIFDRFTQADSSITRKYGGTGLGLTISQSLANLMGGRMWVDSEYGRGSTFYFDAVFQRPADLEAAETETGPAAALARTGDRRPLDLLLVEDNEDNRLLIQTFLKKTPHRIETAENGRVAVDRFAAGRYDLILMDIQMPVMDGYAATRAIRDMEAGMNRARTPIVALTAHALVEDVEKSLAAGCDGHLTKPIKKSRLLAAIESFTQEASAGGGEQGADS
jgi:CheY-like chemotaxis protein